MAEHESKTVEVPEEQLRDIINQNIEMKKAIKEAVQNFEFIENVLGLKNGAETGNLTLKIPKILGQVTRNPQQFAHLTNSIEKLKTFAV